MTMRNNTDGKNRTVRITATLIQSKYERLTELADKNKVSVAWLVRRATDRLIEEMDGGLKLPFED